MTLNDFIEERVQKWRRRYEFSDGMIDTSFDVVAQDLRSDLRECAERTVEAVGGVGDNWPLTPRAQRQVLVTNIPAWLSANDESHEKSDTSREYGQDSHAQDDPVFKADNNDSPMTDNAPSIEGASDPAPGGANEPESEGGTGAPGRADQGEERGPQAVEEGAQTTQQGS